MEAHGFLHKQESTCSQKSGALQETKAFLCHQKMTRPSTKVTGNAERIGQVANTEIFRTGKLMGTRCSGSAR